MHDVYKRIQPVLVRPWHSSCLRSGATTVKADWLFVRACVGLGWEVRGMPIIPWKKRGEIKLKTCPQTRSHVREVCHHQLCWRSEHCCKQVSCYPSWNQRASRDGRNTCTNVANTIPPQRYLTQKRSFKIYTIHRNLRNSRLINIKHIFFKVKEFDITSKFHFTSSYHWYN